MLDRQPIPGWVTYLRVSNEDKQTPERSFAMQRQRIEEHLFADSDIPFQREYFDIFTGTTPKRADYQQMLADAEAGKFSHLALYRADRFGRDAVEGLQAATRLIAFGIRIRVAHMPSLAPETPDGFFMFMLQMGLAQREVEVLKDRVADGMRVKYLAGGWSGKAPEGYANKEELLKSNKYYRWVEIHPEYSQPLREAWDLLLTGRYTVSEICEELNRRGYVRSTGHPWVWSDSRTGQKRDARSRLTNIFHNAFYAGWVVSRRFKIAYGEVRGTWEPLVTEEEYKRGIEILREHDHKKMRTRRHAYLLRNILWVKVEEDLHRLYGSTTFKNNRGYPYYLTRNKPGGTQVVIPCQVLDDQIPIWLSGVGIHSDLLPTIRRVYEEQISTVQQEDRLSKVEKFRQRLNQLKEEELKLGRLLIMGKITQDTFDQLRDEWTTKVRRTQSDLEIMERDTTRYLNDLEIALLLLTKMSTVFARLDEKQRTSLLQILAKRIIVSPDGEIIDYELHSPFMYLSHIANSLRTGTKSLIMVPSGPPICLPKLAMRRQQPMLLRSGRVSPSALSTAIFPIRMLSCARWRLDITRKSESCSTRFSPAM